MAAFSLSKAWHISHGVMAASVLIGSAAALASTGAGFGVVDLALKFGADYAGMFQGLLGVGELPDAFNTMASNEALTGAWANAPAGHVHGTVAGAAGVPGAEHAEHAAHAAAAPSVAEHAAHGCSIDNPGHSKMYSDFVATLANEGRYDAVSQIAEQQYNGSLWEFFADNQKHACIS